MSAVTVKIRPAAPANAAELHQFELEVCDVGGVGALELNSQHVRATAPREPQRVSGPALPEDIRQEANVHAEAIGPLPWNTETGESCRSSDRRATWERSQPSSEMPSWSAQKEARQQLSTMAAATCFTWTAGANVTSKAAGGWFAPRRPPTASAAVHAGARKRHAVPPAQSTLYSSQGHT